MRRTTSQLSNFVLGDFEVPLEKALLRLLFNVVVVVVEWDPSCAYCTTCQVLNCWRLCRYLNRIIKRSIDEPSKAMIT